MVCINNIEKYIGFLNIAFVEFKGTTCTRGFRFDTTDESLKLAVTNFAWTVIGNSHINVIWNTFICQQSQIYGRCEIFRLHLANLKYSERV
jgi:hypothetical protein